MAGGATRSKKLINIIPDPEPGEQIIDEIPQPGDDFIVSVRASGSIVSLASTRTGAQHDMFPQAARLVAKAILAALEECDE